MDEAACEICGHEDAERGLYDACSMCSSTVPLATEPEPDVLERLEALEEFMLAVLAHAKVGHPPKMRIRRSDVDSLADAIAEIGRLEKSKQCLAETNMSLLDDMEVLQTKLRAITEAEPVRWEYRQHKRGDWTICKSHINIDLFRKNPSYEVRALAVVAPKGDTEE